MEHDNLTEEQRRARVTIVEEPRIHRAKPGFGESEIFLIVSGFATSEEVRTWKVSDLKNRLRFPTGTRYGSGFRGGLHGYFPVPDTSLFLEWRKFVCESRSKCLRPIRFTGPR